jgi:predicted permease
MITEFLTRLRFMIFRKEHSELDDELRFHLEQSIAVKVATGLTASEARRQALIEFGGVECTREQCDQQRPGRWIESLAQDVRYALRGLLKNPGFSVVAILSLALGIGASTSMFSLIYAVLLDPVPYADWQRLTYPILLNDDQPGSPQRWFTLTPSQYQELLKARSIDDAVGTQNISSEITGHDIPEDITVSYVTENISDFLRVPPLLGRNLQLSDANAGGQQAPIVLTYDFWMRHYNGDRDVLGRVLEIDHNPYTIVGVMPRRYTWEPDVFVPASLLPDRDRNPMPVMRLKPGVSLATADAEIGAMLQQFAKETPQNFPSRFRVHLEHITDRILGIMGHALLLLFAAVVMLLIIGCVNCSILLLARGMSRQNELAVRTALGASRFRIVRQLLVEALVLAIAGSLIGIVLAYFLARITFGLFPDVFMHESVITVNLPILAFSIALALVSGIFFGMVPSLRMSRPDVSQVMQASGRKIAGRSGQARSLNTLIAAQIALTVVLMGAAGAAIGGFMRVTHQNFGYDPARVMAVPLPLHRNAFLTRESRAAYLEALRQKIATVPGVTQVGVSTNATPPHSGSSLAFEILGAPSVQQEHLRGNFVDSEYFSALHIPLLQGRLWDESENTRGAAAAVINQTLAKRFFPNGNPIGQQIRLSTLRIPPSNGGEVVGVQDTDGWLQIVGVVADSLNDGLDKPVLPALYMPYTRFMWMSTQFLVRTQGPPLAALRSVRLAIHSVNPDQQAVRNVGDLEVWIEHQPEWQQHRLFSILFGVFSGLALVLALIGLYSVISYSVAQRTNEFGIRMALGAQRGHVLWTVARNVGITVGSGLAAGLAITLSIQKFLTQWTANNAHDPLVLAAVALLFLLSAAGACVLPALRATSIDPVQALRYE